MKMAHPDRLSLVRFFWSKQGQPKVAQVTGIVVMSIVVLGTDTDVLLAVPLGIVAGGIATFFVALSAYGANSRER